MEPFPGAIGIPQLTGRKNSGNRNINIIAHRGLHTISYTVVLLVQDYCVCGR